MEKKHQTNVMDLEMARNFFKPKTTSVKVKKQSENLTNVQITSSSKSCKANQVSHVLLLHQKLQVMHTFTRLFRPKDWKSYGH